MRYTIEQLSKLLNRRPRTLYRMHIEHGIGTLGEVAEGRRLVFTEEEYAYLAELFADKSRDRLLTNQTVAEVIDVLMQTPMTVYDLARKLKVKKSSMQTLITTMTMSFEELVENYKGVLYWKGSSVPDMDEGARIRHVYKSYISDKIIRWYTYSNVGVGNDPGYLHIATDKCLYEEDITGRLAYEHDIIIIGDAKVEAYEDIGKEFKIIGDIYGE